MRAAIAGASMGMNFGMAAMVAGPVGFGVGAAFAVTGFATNLSAQKEKCKAEREMAEQNM